MGRVDPVATAPLLLFTEHPVGVFAVACDEIAIVGRPDPERRNHPQLPNAGGDRSKSFRIDVAARMKTIHSWNARRTPGVVTPLPVHPAAELLRPGGEEFDEFFDVFLNAPGAGTELKRIPAHPADRRRFEAVTFANGSVGNVEFPAAELLVDTEGELTTEVQPVDVVEAVVLRRPVVADPERTSGAEFERPVGEPVEQGVVAGGDRRTAGGAEHPVVAVESYPEGGTLRLRTPDEQPAHVQFGAGHHTEPQTLLVEPKSDCKRRRPLRAVSVGNASDQAFERGDNLAPAGAVGGDLNAATSGGDVHGSVAKEEGLPRFAWRRIKALEIAGILSELHGKISVIEVHAVSLFSRVQEPVPPGTGPRLPFPVKYTATTAEYQPGFRKIFKKEGRSEYRRKIRARQLVNPPRPVYITFEFSNVQPGEGHG